MTYNDYDRIEAVRATHIKAMITGSPLHYRYAVDHPDEGDTPSRRTLRAIHSRILTPSLFIREYSTFDGRRGTKLYEAHCLSHPGTEVLNVRESEEVDHIYKAVHSHPVARSMFDEQTMVEETLTWTDEATGLPCKARLDMGQMSSDPWFADLKTYQSCDPRVVGRGVASLLWHVQFAHYLDGFVDTFGIKPTIRLLVVEQKPPHDVAVFTVSDEVIALGDRLRREALNDIAECKAMGKWPGRFPAEAELGVDDLPGWADPDAGIEDEIHDGGEG